MSQRSAQSLPALLRADLLARYPEAAGWGALRAAVRFLADPSLQAVLTLRLILLTPGRFLWLWRTWYIARYRMEIFRVEVGPGLHLPHPCNIIMAVGTKIGSEVTMYNDVNIGFARAPQPGKTLPSPTIGDNVVIGAGAWIVGPITVGSGARLEPGAFVSRDVEPGSVVKAHPSLTGG